MNCVGGHQLNSSFKCFANRTADLIAKNVLEKDMGFKITDSDVINFIKHNKERISPEKKLDINLVKFCEGVA